MYCVKCCGTGKYLGNGMLMTKCDICKGTGDYKQSFTNEIQENITNVKVDKRSLSYKTAIKDIMALDPKLTKAQAAKMFDENYAKL